MHAQIMVSAKYCSRWEQAEHLQSSGFVSVAVEEMSTLDTGRLVMCLGHG